MHLDATGNVGIGTDNPGMTLDVNGTARATSFVGGGSQLTGIGAGSLTNGSISDAMLATNINITTTGAITAGSFTLNDNLNVDGGTLQVDAVDLPKDGKVFVYGPRSGRFSRY